MKAFPNRKGMNELAGFFTLRFIYGNRPLTCCCQANRNNSDLLNFPN